MNWMSDYEEMVQVLEEIVGVNSAVTIPFIERKTGLKILTKGDDHGEIVTEADRKASQYLLDGGIKGVLGLRQRFRGSFSEEDDSPERTSALEIFQVDPIDGTGDFSDTYQSGRAIGPTTLVSRLRRSSIKDTFVPVGGIIFDTLYQHAVVSDGSKIGLFSVDKRGKLQDVDFELKSPEWNNGQTLRLNRRVCYPQLVFDGPFKEFLRREYGVSLENVNVGGAGTFAMQFFRNYIQPTSTNGQSFASLEPITIGFNAQPDWKTWDTDPTEVIASALGLPERTTIYGEPITANANAPDLRGMHHSKGYVLAPSRSLRDMLTEAAIRFKERNPDANLLGKDYGYKDAILGLRPLKN